MLHWVTQNAEPNSVTIHPGIGMVQPSGQKKVTRTKTTEFTLKLTASGRDDMTKSLTLEVRSRSECSNRPVAYVKYAGSGGCREGKGFSDGELRAAGLTIPDVMRLFETRRYFIDTRRRSVHRVNIDTLRRLRDA